MPDRTPSTEPARRRGTNAPAVGSSTKATAPAKSPAAKKSAATRAPAAKAPVATRSAAKKAPAAKQTAATKAPAARKAAAATRSATAKPPAAKKASGVKAPPAAKKASGVKPPAAKKTASAKAPVIKKATAKGPVPKPTVAKGTSPAEPAVRPAPRQLPPPSKGPGMNDRRWPAGPEVRIPVERQKAAQAAGTFELTDLPSWLSNPVGAVRVGKGESSDVHLVPSGVRSLDSIARLRPGQVIVNFGKSEAKWVTDYSRRRGGRAGLLQLLSYARQMVGVDSAGKVRICLMGHAGQGFSEPLWVERDGVVLTVQPNDIILRIEGLDLGE